MMDVVSEYTSTGIKMLHHMKAITAFLEGTATPISLQVAPTSRCNLKCTFCSNVNRSSHEDLNLEDLLHVIERLRKIGLKTVEITGGGDPTLYRYINELIENCYISGLQVGLITNGIELKDKVSDCNLDKLSWVRISMNCLDYVPDIKIPEIKGTLGFSYVINDRTTYHTLYKVRDYANEHQAKYVRIVPNCQASFEEQDKNNRTLPKLARELGHLFFYQTKEFRRPKECYWGYFKPFILHDSYVYPCSSVVLNDNSDRRFHERYRWCKMVNLPKLYSNNVVGLSSEGCEHCVFTVQNEMLIGLLEKTGMENFV
jgi:MoaA/NifB/PqqE/SkfB family radical SAM enzyme